MSDPTRVTGNRAFCYVCEHNWNRSQGGLECPQCGSEFVEILEENANPTESSPSPPLTTPSQLQRSPSETLNPFHEHNPWAPDPAEDDITTFEFNTSGGGRGTLSFTSRTFTYGPNGRSDHDPAIEEIGRNFETMLAGMLGGHNNRRPAPMISGSMFQFPPQQRRIFGNSPPPHHPPDLFSALIGAGMPGTRQVNRQAGPFDLLSMLFNPSNAQHGDTVFSQEAFDRVMTQLMEQNNGSGAPPASDSAINSLKKKRVDEAMMGTEGQAECSICMDEVKLGDEVTVLPCNHWFHGDCVVSWLKEHDTCPHCRQPISSADESTQTMPTPTNAHDSTTANSASQYGPQIINSSEGIRDARRRFYGDVHESNIDRTRSDRRTNSRSDGNNGDRPSNNNGGVGGWIRNHMPFS